METITWGDFEKVDMRVGTILEAEVLEGLRNPAYKLKIDFGELGIKKSSAQITHRYQPADLIGKQVIAVVNFPPKQIGTFISECLVMGSYGENREVTLLSPSLPCKNGERVG
jgi:tRNA-binding protein